MTARRQGWDLATFRCGRCGYRFSTNSEADYVTRVADHTEAHDLVSMVAPALRDELTRLMPHLAAILR